MPVKSSLLVRNSEGHRLCIVRDPEMLIMGKSKHQHILVHTANDLKYGPASILLEVSCKQPRKKAHSMLKKIIIISSIHKKRMRKNVQSKALRTLELENMRRKLRAMWAKGRGSYICLIDVAERHKNGGGVIFQERWLYQVQAGKTQV